MAGLRGRRGARGAEGGFGGLGTARGTRKLAPRPPITPPSRPCRRRSALQAKAFPRSRAGRPRPAARRGARAAAGRAGRRAPGPGRPRTPPAPPPSSSAPPDRAPRSRSRSAPNPRPRPSWTRRRPTGWGGGEDHKGGGSTRPWTPPSPATPPTPTSPPGERRDWTRRRPRRGGCAREMAVVRLDVARHDWAGDTPAPGLVHPATPPPRHPGNGEIGHDDDRDEAAVPGRLLTRPLRVPPEQTARSTPPLTSFNPTQGCFASKEASAPTFAAANKPAGAPSGGSAKKGSMVSEASTVRSATWKLTAHPAPSLACRKTLLLPTSWARSWARARSERRTRPSRRAGPGPRWR